jgi:hypothetical protein
MAPDNRTTGNRSAAVWLEISEEGGAFFLLNLDAAGKCFDDTWYQTLESAQREATFGFGISSEE